MSRIDLTQRLANPQGDPAGRCTPAIAEIVGRYLPYLWLKQGGSVWLLLPAAASLALFAWLLTTHPTAAGRIYAASGGAYVATALIWLWIVDDVPLTTWDALGAAVTPLGQSAHHRCHPFGRLKHVPLRHAPAGTA